MRIKMPAVRIAQGETDLRDFQISRAFLIDAFN